MEGEPRLERLAREVIGEHGSAGARQIRYVLIARSLRVTTYELTYLSRPRLLIINEKLPTKSSKIQTPRQSYGVR